MVDTDDITDKASNAVGSGNKEQKANETTLMNGVFYGAIVYLLGYLWVFIHLRNTNVKENISQAVYGKPKAELSGGEEESLSWVLPGTGDYAAWVYHYAMGGDVSASINLLPGSYPLNEQFLTPPRPEGVESQEKTFHDLRESVLNHPWELITEVDLFIKRGVTSPGAFFSNEAFVFITPTLLFFAGFLVAYRNNETTTIGGAAAGSKITSGFLLASIASAYFMTTTISGFSIGAAGGFESSVGISKIIEIEAGTFAEMSGEVEPVIDIGPSFARAVLIGVVYPLVFATSGGAAAATAQKLNPKAITNIFDD